MDPVTDAIEQAARGGVELTPAQIDYLRQMQLKRGPGVRFVVHTKPMLGIAILDPSHEEIMAKREQERVDLPAWAHQLRREAVAIALPDWTWQDGDQADLETFAEYERDSFKGIGFFVSAWRPGTDMRMNKSVTGEEAAGLIHTLLEGGRSTEGTTP